MLKFSWWLSTALILTLLSGIIGPRPSGATVDWEAKVDPWVLSTASAGETEFLVFLQEQADLSAAVALNSKSAKGAYVYQTLAATAAASQSSLQAQLDAAGISYKPYWLVNALWVRGDLQLVRQLAQRPDIAHIYANPSVEISLPEQNQRPWPQVALGIEPNILQINADDVWNAGFRGEGVVIAGADTGYAWDHPALINQYRGWNGITAQHDYNWHDATGLAPAAPVDPYGHGTHTMGTMIGDDGGNNQIGVAPGASWIGCRNMDNSGNGTPARYIECYQWFIAPTRTDGSDPRPDLAPDIINNSWSCPPSEGCTDPNILLTAVENVNAAGILTVHSAGNSGYSGCSTVNQPAAIYAESFTVGAVDSNNQIAGFSSRGPVTVDGSNRLKPDISAPGVSIRSSIPGDSYGYKQGTSMAAPHIVGVAALLISANPALRGHIETLRNLITQTAMERYTDEGCGGDTAASLPNHTYGWGRVDAWAAYQQLPPGLLVNKTAPESVVPGGVLTYTLSVTNTHPFSITHQLLLTDTLPEDSVFLAATGNYSVTGRSVIWNLGDLAAEASSQVELAVRISETVTGTISNEFFGAVSDEVTTPARGEAVHTLVHIPQISWWLSSTCSNQWVFPGETLNCLHYVYNAGNYTDTFQLSGTSTQGEITVTPPLTTLGIHQSQPVSITIKTPSEAPGGTEITSTVTATSMADPEVSEPLETISHVYYTKMLPLIFTRE